jgi:hypothetical protein
MSVEPTKGHVFSQILSPCSRRLEGGRPAPLQPIQPSTVAPRTRELGEAQHECTHFVDPVIGRPFPWEFHRGRQNIYVIIGDAAAAFNLERKLLYSADRAAPIGGQGFLER